MTNVQNSKHYNLEDRTFQFATQIRSFVAKLPKSISTIEDSKQLIRSSGSIGANYIEANESLRKKDFLMRIKICRKEAKESVHWLRLLNFGENLKSEKERFIQEAVELTKIFGSIVEKTIRGGKILNPNI
jgi:four helix bundle protein